MSDTLTAAAITLIRPNLIISVCTMEPGDLSSFLSHELQRLSELCVCVSVSSQRNSQAWGADIHSLFRKQNGLGQRMKR